MHVQWPVPVAPPCSPMYTADVGGHVLLSMLERQAGRTNPRGTLEKRRMWSYRRNTGHGTACRSAFIDHVAKAPTSY